MRRWGHQAHDLHGSERQAADRSAADAGSRGHPDGSGNHDRRSGHPARNSEAPVADQEHPKHDNLERWRESQPAGLLTTSWEAFRRTIWYPCANRVLVPMVVSV
jgi:hypothetical protein